MAKLLVLDSLGNAVAGSATDIGRTVSSYAEQDLGAADEASVVGSARRFAAKDAAFINTQLGILLDIDETYHNAGHPGTPIVFAAVAAAEKAASSGESLVASVLDAYDVTARLIDAMRPTLAQENSGRCPFGCADAFGPAIAAALVMGLGEEALYDAIGLGGSNARLPISLKSNQPPMSPMKSSQAWHAENGIIAAQLAAKGFHGPRDILDDPSGFWSAAGTDRWLPDELIDRLGEWNSIFDISFKVQPVCRFIHPAIEATLAIAQQHLIEIDEIERVVVQTISRLTSPDYPYIEQRPSDMVSAQFSMPFAVASALRGLPPGAGWYGVDNLNDPVTLSVASKVDLEVDATGEIDDCYRNDMLHLCAKVTVRARGRTFFKRIDYANGDPIRPLMAKDVEDKFAALVGGLMDSSRARRAIALCRRLDELGDVRELTELIVA